MSENKHKIPKKYGIPLFITFLILLLCAGLAIYKTLSEAEEQYYYVSSGEVELVSVSPQNESGIATDSQIIIEWNRPVDESLCEKVELDPSARGNWFVYGNYLIFEPQTLAPGTYYTVSIPAGTTLVKGVSTLKDDLFFAFETENPALRFPNHESLSFGARSYSFAADEEVNIPFSAFGDSKDKLQVTVYQAAETKTYIKALAGLFAYPAWAELSIADFKADTKGFKTLSESEAEMESNGLSLGTLAPGNYLVRVKGDKISRDIAVTVGDFDYHQTYDNGQLLTWCHQDGKALADAAVTCGEARENTDAFGFAALKTDLTPKQAAENPQLLASVINNGKTETVAFLGAEALAPVYRGILALNQKQGGDFSALKTQGSLFTQGGAPVNGDAELRLISNRNTVKKSSVAVENGYFAYQWEDLALVDGTYGVALYYDGAYVAQDSFTVARTAKELLITASADKSAVVSGQSVRYTVHVYNSAGEPVSEGKVLLNGKDAQNLNQKGTAVFETSYQAAASDILKEAEFSVASPWGEADAAKVAVTVKSKSQPQTQSAAKPEGEALGISCIEGTYGVSENADAAAALWYYNEGAYQTANQQSAAVIEGPAELKVAKGESIAADFNYRGENRRISVVSLCKGTLPWDKQGQTCYGEGFNELPGGSVEANAVFNAGQPLSVSFSPLNRVGDYYLRVWCETVGGSHVSYYVPVALKGVVLFADVRDRYTPGKEVTLHFGMNGAEGDYEYSLVLDDAVYTGTAGSDFEVSVGELKKGFYNGKITVSAQGTAVASHEFAFAVAAKQPVAYTFTEGAAKDAVKVYKVKEEDAAALKALCEATAIPCSQIFNRLQSALVSRYWGTEFSPAVTLEDNLAVCQNPNGSFSRLPGGSDDLVLSVLVAEQDTLEYDRDSLLAYLQQSLKSAADAETAALACWGLCCFDVDCSGSLEMVDNSNHNTLRTRLYLAEALWEAGDNAKAEKVYRSLVSDLSDTKNGSCLKGTDEQDTVAVTAFLLDVAVKMKAEEADALMSFLVNSDINYQTGRYLLVKNIVKTVNKAEPVTSAKAKAEKGYAYYSLVPADLSGLPSLDTELTVNGDKVGKIKTDEIAALTVHWDKTENHLYQVCVVANGDCALLPAAADNGYFGNIRQITDGDSFTVMFRAAEPGENIFPRIYVIDLTTGEIIGRGQQEGKVIS